jgi:hypothetical protein
MLIATVPYVGKRLHLDPESDPDPKLNYGSGSTTLAWTTNFVDTVLYIYIPLYPNFNVVILSLFRHNH